KEDSIKLLIKDLKALDPDLISEIQVISLADSKTTPDLLLLDMHDGNSIRIPLSKFKERLPFYKQIKKNLKEPSIVDMEVGVYTTTNTIESTPVKAEDTKNKSTDKTQTQNGQVAENSQGQTNNSNTNQQGQQIATDSNRAGT
ncbi:cell division protein FtsQ, partial [Streptococcus agalactiae]|nr:cell division protein FtsQ [Streptococcus agalactiae]